MRVSFYLFNPEGGLGVGSYVQGPIHKGQWIHVVGVADSSRTFFYKDGQYIRCDTYRGPAQGPCEIHYQAQRAGFEPSVPPQGRRICGPGHTGPMQSVAEKLGCLLAQTASACVQRWPSCGRKAASSHSVTNSSSRSRTRTHTAVESFQVIPSHE